VSSLRYAAFVNGSDPSSVGAVIPSKEQLSEQMEKRGLPGSCGCRARSVRKLSVLAATPGLQQALRNAWVQNNRGKHNIQIVIEIGILNELLLLTSPMKDTKSCYGIIIILIYCWSSCSICSAATPLAIS
jgi:hypothetical protein